MKETQMYVWKIERSKFTKGQLDPSEEFVAAPDLESVLSYLEKDRKDPSVDIVSVAKAVVLSTIL